MSITVFNVLHYVVDIDECSEGISGCFSYVHCTNYDGGYKCSCEPGYTLYLSNNFNGFGETVTAMDGTKPGDVNRVNHTCVREYLH